MSSLKPVKRFVDVPVDVCANAWDEGDISRPDWADSIPEATDQFAALTCAKVGAGPLAATNVRTPDRGLVS